MSIDSPRWNLSNVYPGLQSAEFTAAMAHYAEQVAALERADERSAGLRPGAELAACAPFWAKRPAVQCSHEQAHSWAVHQFVCLHRFPQCAARSIRADLSMCGSAGHPFPVPDGWVGPVLDELLSGWTSRHEFTLREMVHRRKFMLRRWKGWLPSFHNESLSTSRA